MTKSSGSRSGRKAKKPHPDFPLRPHPSGRWCKKVRGRFCYFGPIIDDPQGEAARTLWLDQKDELLAGHIPRSQGAASLADIINAYLADAEQRCAAGELSPLSFRDYQWTGEQMVAHFGRTVDPEH